MKTTWWIVLGCVGLAVIVAVSLGLFLVYGYRDPDNIEVTTNVPLEVTNEPFQLEVAVTNTSRKAQQLHSIDIADSYVEGIAITRSEPSYKKATDIFFYQSYLFERSLAPGKTQTITFTAKPVHAGDFTGDLDVCVGSSGTRCVTSSIRTIVRETETTPTRDDSSLDR